MLDANQSFTSFAGLIGGDSNKVTQPDSAVFGYQNTASGNNSVVLGFSNTASREGSVVSGGDPNTASGPFAGVSGGAGNFARGEYVAVRDGSKNAALGKYSTGRAAAGPRQRVARGPVPGAPRTDLQRSQRLHRRMGSKGRSTACPRRCRGSTESIVGAATGAPARADRDRGRRPS
jgi:hypothetical protein